VHDLSSLERELLTRFDTGQSFSGLSGAGFSISTSAFADSQGWHVAIFE
jgi:hypothetical protein